MQPHIPTMEALYGANSRLTSWFKPLIAILQMCRSSTTWRHSTCTQCKTCSSSATICCMLVSLPTPPPPAIFPLVTPQPPQPGDHGALLFLLQNKAVQQESHVAAGPKTITTSLQLLQSGRALIPPPPPPANTRPLEDPPYVAQFIVLVSMMTSFPVFPA